MRTKVKEASLSTLIHDLDGVFSHFIKLRDTHNGRIKCFICGASMTFAEAQCGHFIDRDQMPTRFDEHNCHAVCEGCNCFDANHKERYAAMILVKYGHDEIERLHHKSKGLQKYMRFEIDELIGHYKKRVSELKK